MAEISIELTVNGQSRRFSGDGDMPLLWFLREELDLVGTKFGCGLPSCGACSVHVDGDLATACSMPMAALEGAAVTTIEGLAPEGQFHAVQQAWIEEDVAQCGYCQPGQIMAAAHLLARNPRPSDADIDAAMTNLCRCGTYARIRKAIHRAAAIAASEA